MPAQSPSKVIVIGSGISGLASAHQLELMGHDVTILEASSQIGGRATTIREMFTDGLYADAGGYRYAEGHHYIRNYIKHLGLTTKPFYPRSGDMLLYLDGKLIKRKSGESVNYDTLPRPLSVEENWMLNQEINENMRRICGGVDKLVYALEDRLNKNVHLYSEVKKIIHSKKEIKVEYSCDGETLVENADFAVCAVPFTSLRNILFEV